MGTIHGGKMNFCFTIPGVWIKFCNANRNNYFGVDVHLGIENIDKVCA